MLSERLVYESNNVPGNYACGDTKECIRCKVTSYTHCGDIVWNLTFRGASSELHLHRYYAEYCLGLSPWSHTTRTCQVLWSVPNSKDERGVKQKIFYIGTSCAQPPVSAWQPPSEGVLVSSLLPARCSSLSWSVHTATIYRSLPDLLAVQSVPAVLPNTISEHSPVPDCYVKWMHLPSIFNWKWNCALKHKVGLWIHTVSGFICVYHW